MASDPPQCSVHLQRRLNAAVRELGADRGARQAVAGAAAAGLATPDIMEGERFFKRAGELGEQPKRLVLGLAGRYPGIGEARGNGLMTGVESVHPDSGDPNPGLARALCYHAKQLGLVVFYVGTKSNVIEPASPLVVTERELGKGVRTLAKLSGTVSPRVSPESTSTPTPAGSANHLLASKAAAIDDERRPSYKR